MNRSTRPKRLWTEDDATMHQGAELGHENVDAAFQRLFGRSLEEAKKIGEAFDGGDHFGWRFPDGVTVTIACDGAFIDREDNNDMDR